MADVTSLPLAGEVISMMILGTGEHALVLTDDEGDDVWHTMFPAFPNAQRARFAAAQRNVLRAGSSTHFAVVCNTGANKTHPCACRVN